MNGEKIYKQLKDQKEILDLDMEEVRNDIKNKIQKINEKKENIIDIPASEILLKNIQEKRKQLDNYENFIFMVDKNPELLLSNMYLEDGDNIVFDEEEKDILKLQEYFLSYLLKIDVFKKDKVTVQYNKNIFPSNVTVFYDKIPVVEINLVQKNYTYLVRNTLKKNRRKISDLNNEIQEIKDKIQDLLPLKSYIASEYNQNTKKFNDKYNFKFYDYFNEHASVFQDIVEDKTMELPFLTDNDIVHDNKALWYLKLILKLKKKYFGYLFFKYDEKCVDYVLNKNDELNETVLLLEDKKKELQNEIDNINEKQKEIDEYVKTLIILLCEYNYSIR